MKLIIINGGSCSGKTTIIKNIMSKKEHLFHLSYDSLKWSFSKYQSDKYYEDIQKVVLAVAECMFRIKYDVISDSNLYKTSRQKLIDMAKGYGYEIVEINLDADYEILSKRFDERLVIAQTDSERRFANLSKERFRELNNIFEKEKNPSAITFRTDNETPEQVTERILALL